MLYSVLSWIMFPWVENAVILSICLHLLFYFTVIQAAILMRKVSAVKGAVTASNTNYSAHSLTQIGSVFYHGATGPEFETLPEDPSLFEMLPDMAEFFSELNEKKVKNMYRN